MYLWFACLCVFLCFSVCLFVCLFACLFVCLFVCLFECLGVCLFVCLNVWVFVCLFVGLLVWVVVSASFCYYTSDPTGTADCEACATTKTLYYDGSLLSGSSYTSLTWFKDSNIATTADAGYYKLVNTEVNTPIYQVSAGPVQTKTLIGYCSDAILTC